MTFQLKEVRFSGNESISSGELNGIVSGEIGKKVGMEDLRKLAEKVKTEYRDQGFIAAYVYLPPQDVTSGNVQIAVIEGKVGKVEIKGNKWFSEKVIRRMLGIAPGSVLFYDHLRAALSYFNRSRDIKAKAVLKPGAEQKTTDVEIDVKDQFPVHLGTDVNNLGTRDTGRARWGISLTDTNLLGQMDQASGRFQIGERAWSVGARYTIPVHSSGTTLGFTYTHSHVNVGGDYKAMNANGDADTYGVDVYQPFFKKSWLDAGGVIGFDFKSIENKLLGNKAGADELRILNVGLNLEFTDRFGKTYFPNYFHFGFSDFMGSSAKWNNGASRPGTGGQFVIYRSSLIRYTPIWNGIMHSLRTNFQLTDFALPPSEQFRTAGAFAVRGYQEGEYMTDYGAVVCNEIFIPSYFFPADWKLPYSNEPMRQQIQGVAFFDFGGGGLRRPMSSEKGSRMLSGAGGGLRIHLYDKVFARLQWGTRTGSAPTTTGSNSVFYYGVSAEV